LTLELDFKQTEVLLFQWGRREVKGEYDELVSSLTRDKSNGAANDISSLLFPRSSHLRLSSLFSGATFLSGHVAIEQTL
jgi:hypothetical protein